jgi:hypothetical protein
MYGSILYSHSECICFHAAFLRRVFFRPDDEGDMILRNVGWAKWGPDMVPELGPVFPCVKYLLTDVL